MDLGMESRSIPDNKITASSERNAGKAAKNGRLNYASGPSWCAKGNDHNPYLQIDLQTLHIICAVSTQGNSRADHWVKTYKLQFSTNGSTWTYYKEDGQLKVRSCCNILYIIIMCKCIRNWPLPIGTFQDQYKQIVINKHNLVKNPIWWEADQLAIYKGRREVELGATENNIS